MYLVIAVAGFLLGSWVMVASVRAIVRGVVSQSWPTATGVIETVTTEKKLNSEGDEVSRQRVVYSYCVGAKTYRGARVRFGLPRTLQWSLSPATFRDGDSVAVIHNPSRPEISTLQRGFSPFVLFALLAASLIVWGSIQVLLLSLRHS